MSDFELLRAILRRSWAEAKETVKAKPHLVYVGSFPRCDYIDLDDAGVSDEDDENSQPSGSVQRRGALHELCRQCVEIGNVDFDEDNQSSGNSDEKDEIYDLARQIIRASHCAINRSSWEQSYGHSFNNSLLTLYEGDQTPLHVICSGNADLGMLSVICESVSLLSEREMATIDLPTVNELLTSGNRMGCTPLHYLAENRSCSADTRVRWNEFCAMRSLPYILMLVIQITP